MIAAAAASPQSIQLGAQKEYVFTRNADWREFRVERRTAPGSALDFSFLLDAPAGKYGFLQVRNGRFVFEKQPNRPIRFYGTNLCTSACTPSKEEADAMAEYLVAHGLDDGRVTKEELSSTTAENVRNSAELLAPGASVGIVTNDFHLYRALRIAEKNGLLGAHGLAAPSNPLYLANATLRECAAIVKDSLVGNI